MTVLPIQYAESVLPESLIRQGGAADKTCPIVFLVFLIRTQGKCILVDAGCDTMPGFVMQNFIGPVKALENAGVSPAEITDLIITHAHHDHIACAHCFPNAVVYIQKEEFEIGKAYLKDCRTVRTFDDAYTVCKGVRIVRIGGHSVGSCVVKINDGAKCYVITGDECYLQACLEEHIPTGASYCAEKSRAFIETYSSDRYIPLVSHDPRVLQP